MQLIKVLLSSFNIRSLFPNREIAVINFFNIYLAVEELVVISYSYIHILHANVIIKF